MEKHGDLQSVSPEGLCPKPEQSYKSMKGAVSNTSTKEDTDKSHNCIDQILTDLKSRSSYNVWVESYLETGKTPDYIHRETYHLQNAMQQTAR